MKPSLLIWGHPRTMSSYIYQTLAPALAHELKEPDVSLQGDPNLPMVGEILNRTHLIQHRDNPNHRVIPKFFNGDVNPTGVVNYTQLEPSPPPQFTRFPIGTPWVQKDVEDKAYPILDRFRGGYLIKEVSQPWLIREYLLANPGAYKVLHIKRNLADVAHRMEALGWWYPASFSSFDPSLSPRQLLVEGLVQIQRTIFDSFPFDAVLDWEEVIQDPDLLWSTVEGMGYSPVRSDWFHEGQQQIRDQRLAYRATAEWAACDTLIRQNGSVMDHPFDHPFWTDTLDFLREHMREGEVASGPAPFQGVLPEGAWKLQGGQFGDWIIVHKGDIEWMHLDLARQLSQMVSLFANEVFVLFAPHRPDVPPYDGVHVNALQKAVKKTLKEEPAAEQATSDRKALEASARAGVTSVGVGDGLVLCRILGRYKFLANMRALEVSPHLIQDGFWESWITLALIRSLTPGGYFVDVGANTGYYTAIMAAASGGHGQTLAVEPQPEFEHTLRSNCIMNGTYGHWTVVCAAAGAENGELKLWTPDGYASSSYLNPTPASPKDVCVGSVPLVVLDDLLKDWPRVDLVKIDVEGSNDIVWEGLKETRKRLETLYFVEYVSGHIRDQAWLEKVLAEGFEVGFVNHQGDIRLGVPPESDTWVMLVIAYDLQSRLGWVGV